MTLRGLFVVTAIAATGCGGMTGGPSGLTGGPSPIQSLETTCTAEVPGAFEVEPRNGNAYMSWTAAPSAHAYDVEVYESDSGALVAEQTLTATGWEWGPRGVGQGPYRARVRTVTECGKSEWSADDVFILNRAGDGVSTPSTPDVPPAPLPAPVEPPPATATCGSLSGRYAVDFRAVNFQSGRSASQAVAIPGGRYRVDVETYDPGHRAGHQRNQTRETVALAVGLPSGGFEEVGITSDIAEAATSALASFDVVVREVSEVRLASAGGDSVHGACIVWNPL